VTLTVTVSERGATRMDDYNQRGLDERCKKEGYFDERRFEFTVSHS
jgi:hypothetical protein